MSRSRRKTPKIAVTGSASVKGAKVKAHRRERIRVRQALRHSAEVIPQTREISDVWDFPKDGHPQWFDPRRFPQLMRK